MTGRDQSSSSRQDFQVGEWLVQPSRNLIDRGGCVRHLEPQVMDLLAFLAGASGRVVSKDQIIDAVWQGRFIAEATLTRSVADLRRALGDEQRAPRYIETIPKRGYRLIASVAPAEAAVRVRPQDGVRGPEAAGERVADRLAVARRNRFVGRSAELEMFRVAASADDPPFVVLHLFGEGGVGKTTLLDEFARVALRAGRVVVRVDGRNIEPSAAGFLIALGQAIGSAELDMPAIIQHWPPSAVLLIDTYERLSPLDDWVRQAVLPQLPAPCLTVIAGRQEPAPAWRTDVAWAALTRVTALGNLGDDDSRAYLKKCGVPDEQHDEAMAFTRGHPLALSLIADMLTRDDRLAPSRLESEPEIVRLLLEAFVQKIPSRDHRLALHACVTAWATTEATVAAALEQSDVQEIFGWLESLPFVEHGPHGLFPHDLARDVVYMNFRWRDPDAAYQVTERVLRYQYERLNRTAGLERQRVWFDILFIQRYNAALRPYFEWASAGTAYAGTASAGERAAILEMVERHEGPASAVIARYWLARQPEAFQAIRQVGGGLIGFAANLSLHAITAADMAADPAIARAVRHAERHGPPAREEAILYGRFWMDAERYQALTPVFMVVAAICSQAWIGPKVAWSFVAMADPDPIEPMFTEIRQRRLRDADFEVAGRRYGVFGHDWRTEPAQEWLRLKAARACCIDHLAAPPPRVPRS